MHFPLSDSWEKKDVGGGSPALVSLLFQAESSWWNSLEFRSGSVHATDSEVQAVLKADVAL